MKFNIEDRLIELTAKQLVINAINPIAGTSNTEVTYSLLDADGKEVERGVKTIPNAALAVLSQSPVDLQQLNQVLTEWQIVATEHIIEQ